MKNVKRLPEFVMGADGTPEANQAITDLAQLGPTVVSADKERCFVTSATALAQYFQSRLTTLMDDEDAGIQFCRDAQAVLDMDRPGLSGKPGEAAMLRTCQYAVSEMLWTICHAHYSTIKKRIFEQNLANELEEQRAMAA